jgi:hypothetical protein
VSLQGLPRIWATYWRKRAMVFHDPRRLANPQIQLSPQCRVLDGGALWLRFVRDSDRVAALGSYHRHSALCPWEFPVVARVVRSMCAIGNGPRIIERPNWVGFGALPHNPTG